MMKPQLFGQLSFDSSRHEISLRQISYSNNGEILSTVCPIPRGSLITLFKTIEGGCALRDFNNIAFSSDYESQWSADMKLQEWLSMMRLNLPARLIRGCDSKTIFGIAKRENFGQGSGYDNCVTELGTQGYEGIHIIESGDHLTLYTHVTEGEIDQLRIRVDAKGLIHLDNVPPNDHNCIMIDGLRSLDLNNRPVFVTPYPC